MTCSGIPHELRWLEQTVFYARDKSVGTSWCMQPVTYREHVSSSSASLKQRKAMHAFRFTTGLHH